MTLVIGSKREITSIQFPCKGHIARLTANDILLHAAHSDIITPNPPIHTAGDNLCPDNLETRNAISRLRKRHDGLFAPLPRIPNLDRGIKTPRHDNTIAISAKSTAIYFAGVCTAPSSQRSRRRHVPEKDAFISSYAYEAVVCLGDGNVEYFIAVSRVCLDQAGRSGRGRYSSRIEQADLTVRRAGQDLDVASGHEKRWYGGR